MCTTQTGLDLMHDLTFHVIFCYSSSSVSWMRCPYSVRRQFTDSFYMASSVYDSFSTRQVTSTLGPSVPNPLLSIPPLPHPLLWSYSWPHALLLHPLSPTCSRQLRFLQCTICNIIHKAFFSTGRSALSSSKEVWK